MRLLNTRCLQSYLIISSILSGGTPDTSYLTKDQKIPSTRSPRWNGRWNVHDGVRPAVLLCGLPHTVANLITDPADPAIIRSSIALASESLKERAIYTVLRHPIEVSINNIYPDAEIG